MAKIKFSALMSDMRGKLNGSVLSKNRGGSYIRNKVTPSNPQTTAQMSVRGIFAGIASAWSTLTESQRLSFNNKVSQYASTDIFGDIRNPSGKALFQKLNQNLSISNQATLTSCPDSAAVPFANVTSATIEVGESDFIVTYSGNTTGSKVVIWATPQLSQGTTFVKNKLRQLEVFTGANAGTPNVYGAYVAKFGAIAEDANIYVGIRTINENGQASPLETIKANFA
jgi:hypothetical protein